MKLILFSLGILYLSYQIYKVFFISTNNYVLESNLTLNYFALQGRGEPIRLLLHYHNIPFNDNHIVVDNWKDYKSAEEGKSLTFGQLPHLQNGDISVVQMNAILSHLDRQIRQKNKIIFSEELLTKQEQYAYGIEDLRQKLTKLAYGSPDGLESFLESLPKYLQHFEQILINNGGYYGKGDYLVGESLTYVDISLWDLIDKLISPKLSPDCLNDFPMLKTHYNRIKEYPTIVAYLESPQRSKQAYGSKAWLNE